MTCCTLWKTSTQQKVLPAAVQWTCLAGTSRTVEPSSPTFKNPPKMPAPSRRHSSIAYNVSSSRICKSSQYSGCCESSPWGLRSESARCCGCTSCEAAEVAAEAAAEVAEVAEAVAEPAEVAEAAAKAAAEAAGESAAETS